MAETQQNSGKIVQIIGVVLDIDFSGGRLPEIYSALQIPRKNTDGIEDVLIAEVQQHLGENRVRAVAMDTTDGLVRGMNVSDTGAPITIPVGPEVLGRLMNVTGDTIDGLEPLKTKLRLPIHRQAPKLEELST
ncbi:MAG: F0F1 ATP synthase subunit beta, partial [Ignavibacteria bacterium]|nr:F0F1 ATP synthase subunit beta [Ignavibacteria bacterium]